MNTFNLIVYGLFAVETTLLYAIWSKEGLSQLPTWKMLITLFVVGGMIFFILVSIAIDIEERKRKRKKGGKK